MRKRSSSFDHQAFWLPKIRWLTRLIWRPDYYHFDKIPATGPCLLICNHVSYVDGLIIAAGCSRPIRFIIDGNIYAKPVIHYFMRHSRAIPILPNKESVTAMLDEVSAALEAGDAICIFPEGQLTYTGSLGRFRPGIEWMIKRNAVPVYPIGLVGLWGSVFSRKYRKAPLRWWPRRWNRKIIAVCGDPIAPQDVTVNQLQRIVLRLKQEAYTIRGQ